MTEDVTTLHGKHEFVTKMPYVAIPVLLILGTSCLVGTFGNILILVAIISDKKLRTLDSIFITNLAISDMYVTAVNVPLSILSKVEGEQFFDNIPGLCQTIASICTVSCVTSIMTISLMSVSRYFYICNHERYERMFTKWNSVCMCISAYSVGCILVSLNLADIGDHGFDRKSLECIWDRMATYPYTVVFSITLVWVPAVVVGVCYLKIYMYVRAHRKRIRDGNSESSNRYQARLHLAKTLFIIYFVFITCWVPYATLIIVDSNDTFPYKLHLIITVVAHLHPSLNWLIYYRTNTKFNSAFNKLFRRCRKHFLSPRINEIHAASANKSGQGQPNGNLTSRNQMREDILCSPKIVQD